jgi:hypothetical protein
MGATSEQELLNLPEHLSSPPVFSGVRVTRSIVVYVCFVDRYLSFCTFFRPSSCLFFFDIRILIAALVSSNLLNSILGPRAKQWTEAPIYTTNHRNNNVNVL